MSLDSVGFKKLVLGSCGKRKSILKLAHELNRWAYSILETGPAWSKKRAAHLLNSSSSFISNFDLELSDALSFMSEEEAFKEARKSFFNGGKHIIDRRPGSPPAYFLNRLSQVLWLSLDLGIKAPPGFHSIFRRTSKEYRVQFQILKEANK